MEDIPSSEPSIAAPAATTSIRLSSLETSGEVRVEERGEDVAVIDQSVRTVEWATQETVDASHDAPESGPHTENDGKAESISVDQPSLSAPGMDVDSHPDSVNDAEASMAAHDTALHPSPPPAQPSTDTGQAQVTAQPQPHAPLKRFTSVNINKRFLEKTSSASGLPLAGGQLTTHTSGTSSASGLGQRRGVSPSRRSPSNDRPASSRLVTAKLTAVSTPSSSSTSGWLRANSSTPVQSATPTPPSSSPQPSPNEAGAVPPSSSSHQPSTKRRPGEPPAPNGSPSPGSAPATQQQGVKPVWSKVPPVPAKVDLGRNVAAKDDFPTAAEAVHGRKSKAKDAAAAQSAAQKQAMLETAAAFRGAHLDANARHWDEMEDEDSDFLSGVIDFADGRQYKIEHKPEPAPSQGSPSHDEAGSSTKDASQSHGPVTKEERFGEDIDRSWPRARTSPVQSISPTTLPPRPTLLQHVSPTDGPASASTQDGCSPTSRVLFNERSNRLEPWSSGKTRSGPPAGSVTSRRDGREEPLPPNSQRQPPHGHQQARDPQSHVHSSAAGVQLLQKGPAGAEPAWKGGSSRGPDRGRWADAQGTRGPLKDEGSSDALDRDGERRGANVPPPVLPSSLAHDRSRESGRQLPPHLSRMPPSPPLRNMAGSVREVPPHTSTARPSTVSPSTSMQSLRSPSSDQAPAMSPHSSAPPAPEVVVDKDALVKDAMQLALERAKKRKQEGEAEEKRRAEAAERARKKAEALAVSQEEKTKAEAQASPEKKQTQQTPQEVTRPPVRLNGLGPHDKRFERPKDEKQTKAGLDGPSAHPPVPQGRPNAAPHTLPRRPSILTVPTHASQADSWRSKAAPLTTTRSPQPPAPPPPRVPLPPPNALQELDLSVKPDEAIEVVDFNDLGKLMGASSPAEAPAPAAEHARPRRAVASDYFDDRPAESREPLPFSKSDQLSWRRPSVTTISQTAASVEECRTQTLPAPVDDASASVKDTTSNYEAKLSSSPTATSQTSKAQSPQGEHGSSSSVSQSVNLPPSTLSSRSPRTSYFKEAPMSTLTDTMSRIKGALDCMQSQDVPNTVSAKELNEKAPDHFGPSSFHASRAKTNEVPAGSWREQRDSRPEGSPQVTRILSPGLVRPMPREVFDVTCMTPPRSPKPVWNAFVVKLPKVSRVREAVLRKQLHFWNLPHPPVRWDILSWEPPVEGMNKRELSRDEIFHRKSVKGGRLRVLLPSRRIVPVIPTPSQESLSALSQQAVVTAAGVKIKLPPGSSSVKQNAAVPSRPGPSDHSRESTVPSWRRNATPLTPLKRDRQPSSTVNNSPPDHQLNTTSRSPPPEPSTPLPLFTKPKRETPSRPSSTVSATVSLPDTKPSVSRRPSGQDVAFFRTSRGDSEGENNNKPLPRFTVTSELDTGESADPTSVRQHPSTLDEATRSGMNAVISRSPRDPSAETFLPRLVASKSESKSSDELVPGTTPMTPPSTHPGSAWGKSPLSFPIKDSPSRTAPDPEHLKAVWSQASERPVGSTSNSLKGIADDLPSIPFTVQDMKSEDGETPPPTAPAPPPSRLSLQEVTRAFQQVPDAPASSAASRPPLYAQTPLLSTGNTPSHRSNQPVAISLPPQQSMRPAFAPYPHAFSPSPTLMYAPAVPSPVSHRMSINGPSPPITHGMWLPTPPPPQAGSYIRPTGVPPAPQMMYPTPAPGTSPGALGQVMPRRMSVVSPGVPHSAPAMYPGHPMDMQNHLHARSPHLANAHPVGHPMSIPVGQMYPSPQAGHAPPMYAVPVGAGRGGMLMPRPNYEGYAAVPPHNANYHSVPSTSFVFQS